MKTKENASVREGDPGFLILRCENCRSVFRRSKSEASWSNGEEATCFECFVMLGFTHGHAAAKFIHAFDPKARIRIQGSLMQEGALIQPVWAAWITELDGWLVGDNEGKIHFHREEGRSLTWIILK